MAKYQVAEEFPLQSELVVTNLRVASPALVILHITPAVLEEMWSKFSESIRVAFARQAASSKACEAESAWHSVPTSVPGHLSFTYPLDDLSRNGRRQMLGLATRRSSTSPLPGDHVGDQSEDKSTTGLCVRTPSAGRDDGIRQPGPHNP